MRALLGCLVFTSVASVAVLGSGCEPKVGGADAGGVDELTPELRVVTETLAAGRVGTSYSQALAATGGRPPYGWHLASRADGLAWLSINATSGVLSGVPTVAAPEGLAVAVSVTDQAAATTTKDFVLKVTACDDGESVTCTHSDAGVCLVGSQQCVAGQLAGVCAGEASPDVAHCGPDCGSCGGAADACVNGACKCGGAAACVEGQACCGGQCKPLDDARSCGSCANDCVAQSGAFVTASCALGQCAFACVVEVGHSHQHCVGSGSTPPTAGVSCETDVATDIKNCGTCQHDCTPTTAEARATVKDLACVSSNCVVVCQSGLLNCDENPSNGCEAAVGIQHCGGCGHACTPGAHQTTPTCTTGSCGYSCEPGFADCNGDGALGSGGNGCETSLWQNNSCGNACAGRVACAADQHCGQGQCVCGNETSPCSPGTACGASGHCECSAASCGGGCCTQVGVGGACYGGTATSACGKGGDLCRTCALKACPESQCNGIKCVHNPVDQPQECWEGSCTCLVSEDCKSQLDCQEP